MSLDWDVGKVKDWKEVCFTKYDEEEGRELRPLTNTFIWGMLSIGLPSITAKNAEEVYKRFSFVEALSGPFRLNKYLTLDEVKSFIGLKTNVSPETVKQFASKQYKFWTPPKRKEKSNGDRS